MLHKGHRSRLRANIMRNGPDAFAIHELFEALLFYSIPYRDTNPTAHLLCNAFGAPMDVFRADTAALCALSGVGTATADFLHLCATIADAMDNERSVVPVYNTPEKAGALFVEAFRGVKEEKVMMLLLNNRSEKIFLGDVHKGSVNSARLRPATLIRYALLHHASFAYLAHNHASSLPIPTSDDLGTSQLMSQGMLAAGIPLNDHFLIAGERYIALKGYRSEGLPRRTSFSSSPDIWTDADTTILPKGEEDVKKRAVEDGKRHLVTLLSYVDKESAENKVKALFAYFPGISAILRASCTDLTAVQGIGEMEAVLLRVVGALLFAPKPTAVQKRKEPITLEQAAECVRELCKGSLRECVVMILLNEKNLLIDTVKISEGVANSANFLCRQLLEAALYRHAEHVIMAHTHPDGNPHPSKPDLRNTEAVREVFTQAGITLVEHLIVTDHSHFCILDYLKKNIPGIDLYE